MILGICLTALVLGPVVGYACYACESKENGMNWLKILDSLGLLLGLSCLVLSFFITDQAYKRENDWFTYFGFVLSVMCCATYYTLKNSLE